MNKDKKIFYKQWWFLCIIVLMIIHILFKIKAPCDFLVAEWSAGELLTFIGTTFLGYVAYKQNERSNELVNENHKLELSRNKPVLEVIPVTIDGITQPFVTKTKKDYDIKFNILNSSPNAAFNIKTIGIWISEIALKNDNETINSKERFEIPSYKFTWNKNYDFQGYLRATDCREFQTGIHFIDDYDIKSLTNKCGGRYFLSITFSFDDCYNNTYIETTTMIISRKTDFETGNLKYERIFDNKIEIQEEK